MRATITPFAIVSIDVDGECYSERVKHYRKQLFKCQAENQGLSTKEVVGVWRGVREDSFIIPTPVEGPELAQALNLAQQWDQEAVLAVNADSSAYLHDLKQGTAKFLGFWKPVHKWQLDKFLASDPDYTYDPETHTHFTVGS